MAVVGIQTFEIVAGNDAVNTGMGFGFGFIDGDNLGVGVGATQHFSIGHADEPNITHILRSARDFHPAISARDRMVYDGEVALFAAHFSLSPAIVAAARWIALTIGR